jgi:outer membrane protein assembly factor BamB
MVPSPVVAGDTIIGCRPRRNALLGFRDGKVAWELDALLPDVCTPLFYRGRLFVLDGDRHILANVDEKTGAVRWQGKLEVTGDLFRASPTGADGKIYCVSEKGSVFVLEAGDSFKVLSTFKIAEPPIRSSIAISQGQIFLRTGKNLYCIGKK